MNISTRAVHIRQHKNDSVPTFKSMDSLVADMERRKMSSAAICFALMAANTVLESTAKAAECSMVYTQVSTTWHKVKSTQGLFFATTKFAAIRKAANAIPKATPKIPAPIKCAQRTQRKRRTHFMAPRLHQRRTVH